MCSSGTPRDLSTSIAMSAEPPISISSDHTNTPCSLTSSQHRIQQQDPSVGNVLGQLVVVQFRLTSLLIPLDQDLSNTYTPTAVPQTLLHGLSRTHDRDTADLALELDTGVSTAYRGGDLLGLCWQVVETFFDKQTDYAVAVEDEICAAGIAITYHALRLLV